MDIYVVDTETTGLDGFLAGDSILEVAICKLNTKNGKITKLYDSLVKPTNFFSEHAWVFSNSDLTPQLIHWHGVPEYIVIKNVQNLLINKFVTSYNKEFDFSRFLDQDPWNISYKQGLPCIMLSATPVCKIPGYYGEYKWPNLYEAFNYLIENKEGYRPSHRAMSDCYASTLILRELIRRNAYNLPIQKEGKKLWLSKLKQLFNMKNKKSSH